MQLPTDECLFGPLLEHDDEVVQAGHHREWDLEELHEFFGDV